MKLIPVIMSGGAGSRLWPVSREAHPKPFMLLPGDQNLIQKTLLRAMELDGVVEILTITNRELLFKTESDYKSVAKNSCVQSFILEPFGRNTAAAVAAAALHLNSVYGADAQMLVLAADHLIADQGAFAEAVKKAQALAEGGWLVTFGIVPEYPETGYGYIKVNSSSGLIDGLKVQDFIEKPDFESAKELVESGECYWNSGMFCFRVGAVLEELQIYAPEVLEAMHIVFEKSRVGGGHEGHLYLDEEDFAKVPNVSIDCALMERSDRVVTVPCDIGWSDIGSWSSVSKLTAADEQGNRCKGEVFLHGARNNYVQSNNRLMALVGVENLVVVETSDAILIADRNSTQDVKHIVSQLKMVGHVSHLEHQVVHRPWGDFTILEDGERFKIKRIVVRPGASLSLQMHHHRSEHWVVVSGMALVVNGDSELMLNTNESTFIKAGHKHRLENPGLIDLVLIEVQSGDYLGEDDIVRFEDAYGRVGAR